MTNQPDEARKITPFKRIGRGQDSLDYDDEVVFADFTPHILPADLDEDEEIIVIPKEESVPEPVASPAPEPQSEVSPTKSAPPAAPSADGKPKTPASSSPASSSPKKSG